MTGWGCQWLISVESGGDEILYYCERVFSLVWVVKLVEQLDPFIYGRKFVLESSPTVVILESFQDQQWPHYEVVSMLVDLLVPGPRGQGLRKGHVDGMSHCGTWIDTGIWYGSTIGKYWVLMKEHAKLGWLSCRNHMQLKWDRAQLHQRFMSS